MQRKLAVAVAATAFVLSAQALAGEALYNPSRKPMDPALQACSKRINLATNRMIVMRGDPQLAQAINRELGLARYNYEQGNLQDCLAHVNKAEAMEH